MKTNIKGVLANKMIRLGHFMVFLVLLGTVLFFSQIIATAADTYYYVSTTGNDTTGNGSLNTPWQTIKKAKDVIKTVNSNMSGNIVVYLRGGSYYLGENTSTAGGLVFDKSDSGTNGYKIMYANYNNEDVTIVGGKRVTGWTLDSGNVYKANVGTSKFYDLYENGVRAVMARTTDTGYLQMQAAVTGFETTKFIFKAGDLTQDINDTYADAQVYVWPGRGQYTIYNWYSKIIPISNIDWSTRTITLQNSTGGVMGADIRYFVRGAKTFLNQSSEFYLNEATGYLYYYPRCSPAANINSQTIVIPTTTKVIALAGVDSNNQVSNLEFRGLKLTVSDCAKYITSSNTGLVSFENANNNTIINCEITNSGYHGVSINTFSTYNKLIGNKFDNIGENGVNLQGMRPGENEHYWYGTPPPPFPNAAASDVNKNNLVTRNTITKVGQHVGHGSGIQITASSNNEISYNIISDAPRYGISLKGMKYGDMVGQTYWGTPVTYANHWDFLNARNNTIKFNDISNVLLDSQDGGVIESYGPGKGNIYDNNRLHDTTSGITNGSTMGLYLDDCSDYFTVKNNIVYGIGGMVNNSHTAHLKGVYNTFTNNIFADNTATFDLTFQAYGGELNDHMTLDKNIIYKTNGNRYYSFFDATWLTTKVTSSDNNVFYHPSGNDKIYRIGAEDTWANWKLLDNNKYDQNSVIADPLFVNSAQHDYTLQESSPALAKGFEQINQADIGTSRVPSKTFQAESYDNMFGLSLAGGALANTDTNDWAKYSDIDFGTGEYTIFKARVSIPDQYAGQNMELRLDSPTGTLIGTLKTEGTGSWSNANVQIAPVTGATGKHDLYIVFKNGSGVSVDWFTFAKATYATSFESGLTGWWSYGGGPTPTTSTVQKHSGNSSFIVTNVDVQAIQKTWTTGMNKVCSIWMYDDATDTTVQTLANVFNTTTSMYLGTSTGLSTTNYVYSLGPNYYTSKVLRTTGWHRLEWDYTSGTDVKLYIDGVKVATSTLATSFNNIILGDIWGGGLSGVTYYDDVSIQDTISTPTIFHEAFNSTFSGWTTLNGTATLSTVQKRTGSSYIMNEDTDAIQYSLGSNYNKWASVWFYDDALDVDMLTAAKISGTGGSVSFGVNTAKSTTEYSYAAGGTWTACAASTPNRITGWHSLTFDYTSGTNIKVYLDVYTLVATITTQGTTFNSITLGDTTADSKLGTVYFEDVKVFNTN